MKASLTCLFLCAAVCASACSGGKGKEAAPASGSAAAPAAASEAKAAKADQAADSSGGLQDGKWPVAIYSKYGIDEISTKGKIVFTSFQNDDSYQYRVYYHGVTQEELKAWTDKLVAKGHRISENDKEKLGKQFDHDVMIYQPNEKQAYRLQLSFDFSKDMEIEYGSEPPGPAFTATEKQEDGSTNYYIYYNLSVSLNPMPTKPEFTGSFDDLGLKAEDLKFSDNIRGVKVDSGRVNGQIKMIFYSDHYVTKEDFEACRNVLIDKFAEKGAKFYDAFRKDKELSAEEMKTGGVKTYNIENNGKKFSVMVDPDSSPDQFGGSYSIRLMMKK